MRAWTARLFNEHKAVRRTGMALVFLIDAGFAALAAYMVLLGIRMPEGVGAIILALLGKDAIFISFYQWSRQYEDRQP